LSRPSPSQAPDVVVPIRYEHDEPHADGPGARASHSLTLDRISIAWNVGLTTLFAILTFLLWSWSMAKLTYVGGLPVLSLDWLMAVVGAPDLLPRIQAYVMVWIYGVLAGGSGLLTIMGLRSVLIRIVGPRMGGEGRR
jgi:hypothetical protein